MRMLRGLLGALLWILGTVLGLVALVLCVTIIGLPLGILLFRVARRFVDRAILLMLPRPVANPAASLRRGRKQARKNVGDATPSVDLDLKKLRKLAGKQAKKSKKALSRGRKRLAG